MSEEYKKVENLLRLDVQPGDRYVMVTGSHITMETKTRIEKEWRKFMGGDIPLLILPPGWEIGVLRTVQKGHRVPIP